jgi:subtilase family serine protease
MKKKITATFAAFLLTTSLLPAQGKLLSGHVPEVVSRLQPVGQLSAAAQIDLAIGLPLRNRDLLSNLVQQLYDPTSTNFHRYLTPSEFTDKFGPTEADYQTVLRFATTNGFSVTHSFAHRELVSVSARVSDIERAFHTHLRTYQHPREQRQFFAPDIEPSVNAAIPIQTVSGLSDYQRAEPGAHRMTAKNTASPAGGSGPSGTFRGKDFPKAYVPGVSITGSGQNVGLVELDGYYPSDITTYESQAGLPNVPITVVPLSGSSGFPTGNTNAVAEVSLDIEMVISMAPGLNRLYVFEGNNFDTILSSMVTNTITYQFSSSWFGGGFDATGDGFLQQMAAQGQTFFQASGDGDAYTQPIPVPADDAFVTSVGGTLLTNDAAGNYVGESVWNSGFQSPGWFGNGAYTNGGTVGGYWGSGGGVSTTVNIPLYQQGVNMASVGGSSTKRNIPDVAMPGVNIWVNYFNGLSGGFEGTSCAAPLWAGFAALANQQCAADGKPNIGFINPALYSIGLTFGFGFHDITSANDTWPLSTGAFFAGPGYDLCTGWGSPNGASMIQALEDFSGPVFVDFNFNGTPQNGRYPTPFKTLAGGTTAVANNGTIVIKTAGHTTETPTISKPMVIRAVGGNAIIGQ